MKNICDKKKGNTGKRIKIKFFCEVKTRLIASLLATQLQTTGNQSITGLIQLHVIFCPNLGQNLSLEGGRILFDSFSTICISPPNLGVKFIEFHESFQQYHFLYLCKCIYATDLLNLVQNLTTNSLKRRRVLIHKSVKIRVIRVICVLFNFIFPNHRFSQNYIVLLPK